MSSDFWNFHTDFESASPKELVQRIWLDDELNRKRSAETLQDEIALVNDGLELFLGAIQGAIQQKSEWGGNDRIRAAIAMLFHGFNTYLVWRHLLSYGYMAEIRQFARSVHESLTRALAFINDEALAKKFFDGQQIQPKVIRKKIASLFDDDNGDRSEVIDQLNRQYSYLSTSSHPTLQSFALRTGAQEPGNDGLRRAVPERVVIGGLLNEDIGRISWLGLSKNISAALSVVGKILTEESGQWETRVEQYQAKVNQIIRDDEFLLDEQYPSAGA